jgi:glycosyltransferase involved in cell wall biosynthesis
MNKVFDLTVILTSYNRPENIEKQIKFINKQTCIPKEIWV